MYNFQDKEQKKEQLILFKYKRQAQDEDDDLGTLIFSNKTKKYANNEKGLDSLTKRMQKMKMDQSIFCLKKIDIEKQPQIKNLIFRTRDLQIERRNQIRNDLIKGLRSNNFPQSIKVCQIQDNWVVCNTNKKKQKMQTEPQHDYYILARDIIDQDKTYHQIQKPRQLGDYIDSEKQFDSQQNDSQDSNRQDNPDNDYPEQDYDFDQQQQQQNYGQYNPYDDYSQEDDY